MRRLDDQAHCRRLITAFYAIMARGYLERGLMRWSPRSSGEVLAEPALSRPTNVEAMGELYAEMAE